MISSTQKQQMKPSYGSQGSHGTQALSGLNGEYGVYATGPSRDDISVDPEKVRHFFLQVKGYYLGYPNPKSLWISICKLWNAMECYGMLWNAMELSFSSRSPKTPKLRSSQSCRFALASTQGASWLSMVIPRKKWRKWRSWHATYL